jgi:CHAT domain-containing protein
VRRPGIAEPEITFPRLPQTSKLAQNLQTNVFSGQPVELLSGISASEQELRKKELAQYRYIVFATHGILDNTVPYLKEPALVFGQIGTDAGERTKDGFLTLSEVMQLKLHADVVALTACQTGLGKNVSGEGVMGLGRAFQYAGAKSVLVSLWSVSEDSTTLMAEKFFTYLKEDKTKREAIRLARADARKKGYEHPFFWAPFILIGE